MLFFKSFLFSSFFFFLFKMFTHIPYLIFIDHVQGVRYNLLLETMKQTSRGIMADLKLC